MTNTKLKPRRFRLRRVLALCLLVALLPMNVHALGSIDSGKAVELTVSCEDGYTALTGVEVELYLVATLSATGEPRAVSPFSAYPVDFSATDSAHYKALATTLEGYILRDGIAPTDTDLTNSYGNACFPASGTALKQGLYLVRANRHTQSGCRYDFSPFLVMLPSRNPETDTWAYTLTAHAKFDSTPVPEVPGETQRRVVKVWKDEGHESQRPKEITVVLLRDGTVYDTVVLSAGNNWRHSWEHLSDKYTWRVVEKELSGYTVTVTREDTAFLVTNTYTATDTPTDPTPGLPQTGQLWWPVPVLLFAGLLLVVLGLSRRRGDRE